MIDARSNTIKILVRIKNPMNKLYVCLSTQGFLVNTRIYESTQVYDIVKCGQKCLNISIIYKNAILKQLTGYHKLPNDYIEFFYILL